MQGNQSSSNQHQAGGGRGFLALHTEEDGEKGGREGEMRIQTNKQTMLSTVIDGLSVNKDVF